MSFAHVCDQCDRRVGDIRLVAFIAEAEKGEFCSVTCLMAWGETEADVSDVPSFSCPKPEPPQVEATPDATAMVRDHVAAKASAAQDSKVKTCEVCGRVGTRRYVPVADAGENRWKCSPTATACAPQFRPPGTVVAKPPPPPSDIPAKDIPPNVTPESFPPNLIEPPKPHITTPGMTAHCTDCTRTWILTGRVLQQAIDMHEQKHSHIVQTVDHELQEAHRGA